MLRDPIISSRSAGSPAPRARRPRPLRAQTLLGAALGCILTCAAPPAADPPGAFQSCEREALHVWGAEDLEVRRTASGSELIASAAERRSGGDPSQDGIYAVPIEPGGLGTPRRLDLSGYDCPLHPHGIALGTWGGRSLLFAIHHVGPSDPERCREPALHRIERFRVEGDLLIHEQTIHHPSISSPNDLEVSDAGELFVSIEPMHRGLLPPLLEALGFARSYVVSVEGADGAPGRVSTVARGIRFANGVALRGDRAYVAGSLDRSIHVYERGAPGEPWRPLREIDVGIMTDNLMWDGDDALLVAGHTGMLALLRHRSSPETRLSGTEVFRVEIGDAAAEPELVHSNDGTAISAGSVAIHEGSALYIGQISGSGIARCEAARPL